MDYPARKHVRLKDYDYSSPGAYFITICTKNRKYLLSHIVCAYKSCVTRKCKSISPIDSLFQASFYEHIIRNLDDYNSIVKYIDENPVNWYYDELYSLK